MINIKLLLLCMKILFKIEPPVFVLLSVSKDSFLGFLSLLHYS